LKPPSRLTGDALWTDLSVLTCLGKTFAGRVAASLVNAVGLPELVRQSLEEYEALARESASFPLTGSASKPDGAALPYGPVFARVSRKLTRPCSIFTSEVRLREASRSR
jgi:Glycosyl transferase family 41